MPYVNKEMRNDLDESINSIVEYIKGLEDGDKEGACNYTVSRIISGGLKPETGWRYKWLNRAYGVFMAAGAEFYGRLVAPYEERAIYKNGDIDEYRERV
jgi:hypothetical protein